MNKNQNMKKRLSKKSCYEAIMNNYTMFYKPMPEEWKKLFPVVTAEVLENFGLHITLNHSGKMTGMQSISDSCKVNTLCVDRIRKSFERLGIDVSDMSTARKAVKEYLKKNPLSTDVCICATCFSDAQQDYQASMQKPLDRNFLILNNGIIHSDWIPVINALFFRFESFGDFASTNSVINSYNFAAANKNVSFTAWTKNLVFFAMAEKQGYKKPENYRLVYSSFFINVKANIPEAWKHLVDAVFTVYTKQFAAKHNITINCGARACLSCLRCYTGFDGHIKEVNELLK